MLLLSTLIAGCAQYDMTSPSLEKHQWMGRCVARIEPAAADIQAALVQTFVEQNGPDWGYASIDPFTREVSTATRGSLVYSPDDPVQVAEEEAIRMARDFAARNADFLGITPGDVDDLTAYAQYNAAAGPLQWSVSLTGRIPILGHEALLPEGRRGRINLSIAKDGGLYQLINRSEQIPAFDICTEPQLAAGDPRLVQEVLGRTLQYFDFSGEPIQTVPIAEEHIVATTLTVHIVRDAEEREVLIGLVYRLDVRVDGLPWTMLVDPDTGALIDIQKLFTT
jgi:hypothetical protein